MVDSKQFIALGVGVALFGLGIVIFLFIIPKYKKTLKENWWRTTPSLRISLLIPLFLLIIGGLYVLMMGMVEIIFGLGLFGVNR